MANSWMVDLPEMASDTPLPITINAIARGKTGEPMKALPRIEFVNAADARAILLVLGEDESSALFRISDLTSPS